MNEVKESRSNRWRGWALLAALLAFWAVAEFLVLRGTFVQNSDSVTPFMQGADMLHGNWTLSGWTGAPDNYYTLDTLLSVGCQSLFGFGFAVLLFQSLLTYGCVIAGALRLSRGPGSAGWINGASLFLFLGLLTYNTMYWFMSLGDHTLTLAVCLACFALAAQLGGEDGWVPRSWAWFAYAGLSFLALAGDPFYKYVALLPILGAAGLAAVWYGRWRTLVKLSVVSGLALVAAKMLVRFLQARGFHINELTALQQSFADFDTIKTNLYTYVRSWWILLGPGDDNLLWLGGAGLSWLAWGFLGLRLLVVAAGVLWTGRILLTRKPAGNPGEVFVDSVLLVGVGLDSAAYVFSRMPQEVDQVYTLHYLLPAAVYASILVVRRGGPGWAARWRAAGPRVRALAPAVFFAALLLFGPRIWELSKGQPNAANFQLVDYLEAKGLQSGYGGYWQSNIIRVLSGQKVKIAALTAYADGKVGPASYLSNLAWYDVPAMFVVFDPTVLYAPDDLGYIVERATIRNFGPPSETARIGPYHVLIWDHDLHDQLERWDKPGQLKFSLDLLKVRRQTLAAGATLNADGSIMDEPPRPQPTPIIYGPYLHLPAGHYRVTYVLMAGEVADADFMICDVAIRQGGQILAKKEIPGSLLVGRTTTSTITLTFDCPGPQEACEFRVWKSGGAKLVLRALTLEKV